MAAVRSLLVIMLLLLLAGGGENALADAGLPTGERQITLVSATGERLSIGRVNFTPEGDARAFTVTLDAPEFRDEFLSMRPFRCLPGAKEMWCHLAYPYDLKGRITAGDLTDLEYSLLFLFKPPTGYGIDAWNGLYFRLDAAADGGITGALHEVNLDVLAAPPDDRAARVITPADLTKAEAGGHRFQSIEIR